MIPNLLHHLQTTYSFLFDELGFKNPVMNPIVEHGMITFHRGDVFLTVAQDAIGGIEVDIGTPRFKSNLAVLKPLICGGDICDIQLGLDEMMSFLRNYLPEVLERLRDNKVRETEDKLNEMAIKRIRRAWPEWPG